MGPRVVLFAVATSCVAACSLLVDSTGLVGGRAPDSSPDGADEASHGGDAAAAEDARMADAGDGAPALHPYVQAVLADGPSLYYRLEEPSDGPVRDETGNYPATYLAGGTHGVPGAFPGSLALGQAKRGGIDPGDIFDFVGRAPFTLEAWFRPEGYDGVYRFLVHHDYDGAGQRQNYGIYVHSNDGIAFERYVDNVVRSAGVVDLPTVGKWHHVVGVYDGSLLRLYVDGAVVATSNDDRSARDKQSPLRIGYGYRAGEGALQGTLDEVAIYEKALAEDRIVAHFEAAK